MQIEKANQEKTFHHFDSRWCKCSQHKHIQKHCKCSQHKQIHFICSAFLFWLCCEHVRCQIDESVFLICRCFSICSASRWIQVKHGREWKGPVIVCDQIILQMHQIIKDFKRGSCHTFSIQIQVQKRTLSLQTKNLRKNWYSNNTTVWFISNNVTEVDENIV